MHCLARKETTPHVARRSARIGLQAILSLLMFGACSAASAGGLYPWVHTPPSGATLFERVPPPPGYERIAAREGSFAAWLRALPLKPAGTPVRLFNGDRKLYQAGALAVVDIDVGTRDLQQCADAVIRLRAEYLYAAGCEDRVTFDFTSGDAAPWSAWMAGRRPHVSGDHVTWNLQSALDSSYGAFREYLNSVFAYAGSYSLSRQMAVVDNPSAVAPGDVFISGGFPGHAVLVADVAGDSTGQRAFLLLQSYMPAQDIHLLTNPADPNSPWYPARREGTLRTPEWTFLYGDLRRFPGGDCK
jgi:hypothetical protein